MTDHSKNIENWASNDLGAPFPTQDASQIRANLETRLSQHVTIHTDETGLNVNSQARAHQGPFFDPDDILRYFDEGNLLLFDQNDNPVPNPILHLVSRFDPDYDSLVYDIYIDEDSL